MGSSLLTAALFAHRLTLHLDAVGVMHDPIENAVRQGRIADLLVPLGHGELAGQNRGSDLVAIFTDFQEVAALGVRQRRHRPVIDHQQIKAGYAGEQGALGDEDQVIVRPAVERLNAEGIEARGPLPADSLFHQAARAGFDVVLAMYHDQALIPIKTLAFDHAVNVTLGLPFVRTSPDHGTAFDIAGTGRASPGSLIAALQLAARLAGPVESGVMKLRA